MLMNLDEILTALQQRTIGPEEAETLLRALDEQQGVPGAEPAADVRPRHPLLHENTSDLSEQRFTATFTGQEPFLADHVVKGDRVLPGVVYLEMARAAVAEAAALAGNDAAGHTGVVLENVVWSRPFIAGSIAVPLHIALSPGENGRIAYEIYTDTADGVVVHSQGVAAIRDLPRLPPADLPLLRSLCSLGSMGAARCYDVFHARGVEYGPAHRAMQKVSVGIEDGRRFVLADVVLPESVTGTHADYVLHPSIMDAALQAPLGLMVGSAAGSVSTKPALPFALGQLLILRPCPSAGVVIVREDAGSSDRVRKLNIDICDGAGNVCVRLSGFSSRVLEGAGGEAAAGTMLLASTFAAVPAPDADAGAEEAGAQWVVLCDEAARHHEELQTLQPGLRCVAFDGEAGDVARRFGNHAGMLLELIQEILEGKPRGSVLLQVVIPSEGEGWLLSGLSGLMKTAQMESPKLIPQLIGVESGDTAATLLQKLRQNSHRRTDAVVRYQSGTRFVARFSELAAAPH
jgi:polyketide synthase PksN